MCTRPKNALPLCYIWQDKLLFISSTGAWGERQHLKSPAVTLCIGVEGNVDVTCLNSMNVFSSRSCLISQTCSWQSSFKDNFVVSLIMDSSSLMARHIRADMQKQYRVIGTDYRREKDCIAFFKQIYEQRPNIDQLATMLDDFFIGDKKDKPIAALDKRVERVLECLQSTHAVNQKQSIAELADLVNLSEYRLMHLFKDNTGLTVGRYQLWRRFIESTRYVMSGHKITDAAIKGGFSDASHFSREFKNLIGIKPSKLLLSPVDIHI